MILPEVYTVQKFYQLAGYVRSKHGSRIYDGGCPVCREGKSWGRKRRLYFILKDNLIYCHNCGWSGNPIKFIKEVEGLSYDNILAECKEYDILPKEVEIDEKKTYIREPEILPRDSINLLDSSQLTYYKDDEIVKQVYDVIKRRNLLSACNRPKTLWVSLNDYIHKHRLIIPFYDTNGQIVFYQTRTVIDTENVPKYLSKVDSDKSLFNIDNVDSTLDTLFIFEGPIDACFCKNGIAVAGIQENSTISFNACQLQQLRSFNLFNKVWTLDSQWQDRASKIKTKQLIEQGESVFIWPKKYGVQFKDFNEMAVGLNINEIPYKFILDNTHTGLKANLLLNVT